MSTQKADKILKRYLKRTADEAEQAKVESWFNEAARDSIHRHRENDLEVIRQEIWFNLSRARKQAAVRLKLWPRIAAAAVVLAILAFGLLIYVQRTIIEPVPIAEHIRPAIHNAILTLANGKKVELKNDIAAVTVGKEGNNLKNVTHGMLVYRSDHAITALRRSVSYNTLETPKGGHYRLILPDGTKVWLNAGSSITYPTIFTTTDRVVKLNGEAYFEVRKDPKHPFKVRSLLQEIAVLGTHFNVKSYTQENAAVTSLLEGKVSIEVLKNHKIKSLSPGEQVKLTADKVEYTGGNVNDAVAWKDGYFRFSEDSIEVIMRTLARWYDIDVSYNGYPTGETFTGRISNTKNIAEVLNMLQKTKLVHFKIEGRRVTVMR